MRTQYLSTDDGRTRGYEFWKNGKIVSEETMVGNLRLSASSPVCWKVTGAIVGSGRDGIGWEGQGATTEAMIAVVVVDLLLSVTRGAGILGVRIAFDTPLN
jgi:hypothetical protein